MMEPMVFDKEWQTVEEKIARHSQDGVTSSRYYLGSTVSSLIFGFSLNELQTTVDYARFFLSFSWI